MADDQIAVPLQISGLVANRGLIASTTSLLQLYIRNLIDLKSLDPQCTSESAEKLAKVIWYYKVEALEPAEKVYRNLESGVVISESLERVERLMSDIWDAYAARTTRQFDRTPHYISCKSTMELLLCLVVEMHMVTDIGMASK